MAASPGILDVGPDEEAVDKVQAWFLDYQATHDPAVRERIILATWGWPIGWPSVSEATPASPTTNA